MTSEVSAGQSTEVVPHIYRPRQSRLGVRDARSMRRVIIKQGYLKKMPNSAKLGSSFRRPELRWFIFGVINGSYPYLEYYENEECIFNSRPIKTIFLDSCLSLTRNQRTSRHNYVFTLVMRDRSLSLVADNRDVMNEWCRAIEDKLHTLHIIDTIGGDNDYVKVPASRRPNRPTSVPVPAPVSLQPAAPSPDISSAPELSASRPDSAEPIVYETLRQDATVPGFPQENPYLVPEIELHRAAQPVDLTELLANQQLNAAVGNSSVPTASVSRNQGIVRKACEEPCAAYEPAQPQANEPSQFPPQELLLYTNFGDIEVTECSPTSEAFENLDLSTDAPVFNVPSPVASTTATTSDLRRPSLPSAQPLMNVAGPSPSRSPDGHPHPFRLPSYEESMSPDAASLSMSPVASPLLSPDEVTDEIRPSASALPGYESPPAYVSEKLLEMNANTPLKSRQVQQLQDEMSSTAGIRVQLDKTQCAQALALIDCFNRVWIAGWNRRAYPLLQTSFHIGDELISINDKPVTSAKAAMKILKSCADRIAAQLALRRLPLGHVCLLRRSDNNFESLGLQTVSGTAEISEVNEDGLAAVHGLPLHATNIDDGWHCNWWITEVNHRTLNLFYRDGEVVKRLSASGSHLSFVAQPAPLISEMKRRLKTMKYFKDYLIE